MSNPYLAPFDMIVDIDGVLHSVSSERTVFYNVSDFLVDASTRKVDGYFERIYFMIIDDGGSNTEIAVYRRSSSGTYTLVNSEFTQFLGLNQSINVQKLPTTWNASNAPIMQYYEGTFPTSPTKGPKALPAPTGPPGPRGPELEVSGNEGEKGRNANINIWIP